MALQPTPENFRQEMGRFRLTRYDVCDPIGMNKNSLTMFVNGSRPLTKWASHNIGYGINVATGLRLIDVDMSQGLMKPDHRERRRLPPHIPAQPKPKTRRRKKHVSRDPLS